MRLRMKVWTDPHGVRYLMPVGLIVDPRMMAVRAYAMTDEKTMLVVLSAEEWDRLPFFYFVEDGECTLAERPKRPPDIVR